MKTPTIVIDIDARNPSNEPFYKLNLDQSLKLQFSLMETSSLKHDVNELFGLDSAHASVR